MFTKLLGDSETEEKLPGDEEPTEKKSNFFFCLNMKEYFQIEQEELMERMKAALLLKPAFREVMRNQPDLYGPFWLATTLVIIILASSSLITFFAHTDQQPIHYDFEQIPVAAGLIYGICFISPYVIGIMVKVFKGSASVVELICIYGYSLTIFLPITALCFLDSVILQTILLAVGFCSSSTFLIRGVLSIDRTMGDRERIAIGVFIMGVQFVMVLMYKFYFFDLI